MFTLSQLTLHLLRDMSDWNLWRFKDDEVNLVLSSKCLLLWYTIYACKQTGFFLKILSIFGSHCKQIFSFKFFKIAVYCAMNICSPAGHIHCTLQTESHLKLRLKQCSGSGSVGSTRFRLPGYGSKGQNINQKLRKKNYSQNLNN